MTISSTPQLGAHMSVAGGLHLSIERIKKVGGVALQIFTRNQRQWSHRPLTQEEGLNFLEARKRLGIRHVFSHASYLVNLASPKRALWERSIEAMVEELKRCHELGIPWVVLHPGSHSGVGVEEGLSRCVDGLDAIFSRVDSSVTCGILLETTSGQGTSLGSSLEELAFIVEQSSYSDRLGLCVDTCHIFSAGYDIRSSEGFHWFFEEVERLLGLKRIRLFHLNDSKKGLASRIDRHEHIGRGEIGLDAFRFLLNHKEFCHIPMVLETPKGKDLEEDVMNLGVLRGLLEKRPNTPSSFILA